MSSTQQTVETARPGGAVIGWKLAASDRAALLARFPPRYSNVVADHVTLAARVAADTPPPSDTEATIVGRIDDGSGVEALVVAIDGSTERPGGGTYHITWSLAPGRRAKESNDVLAKQKWSPLEPVPVRLVGARVG